MFDFSWSELALIGVVALVVIGPKDLPRVMRTVGLWVGKARTIAREFQSSLDQMIRESELEEMRKSVEQASNVNLAREIERTIDPAGELQKSLDPPSSPAAATTSEPSSPAIAAPAPSAPGPDGSASSAPPKSGTHD
ncbi:MAG TPA: Sec-independent protein translocase protein TatB [Stellaceae bacterium]|nr:Sec-independent protein translocase protein TatB [Stellaceae bacterium]